MASRFGVSASALVQARDAVNRELPTHLRNALKELKEIIAKT